MKRLILILILVFSFQSFSKANDIREFQVEDMSIGDSLLKFMSLNEINNNTFENYFKNGKKRKYYATGFFDTDKYDQLEIYIKTGDNNFKIKAITGFKQINNLQKCLSLKKEIVDEIQNLFIDIEPVTYNDVPHTFDKSGKSKQYQTAFLLKDHRAKDHIRIECTKWSKKMKKEKGFVDTLGISVFSTETLEWVDKGYQFV
jgi:predicted RND superfamily exporter protein